MLRFLNFICPIRITYLNNIGRIPVAALSKSWVCVHSLAGNVGSKLLRRCTSTQQLDPPDSTNIPMRYTVYGMMLLLMDC